MMILSETRPTHPGIFIQEDILEEFNLTQEALAQRLGVSRRSINQLVTASAVSRPILGQFTSHHPQLWLNLQAAVDLWDAQQTAVSYAPIEPIVPQPEPLPA